MLTSVNSHFDELSSSSLRLLLLMQLVSMRYRITVNVSGDRQQMQRLIASQSQSIHLCCLPSLSAASLS